MGVGAVVVGVFVLVVMVVLLVSGRGLTHLCPKCLRIVHGKLGLRKDTWPTHCHCGDVVQPEAWTAYWKGVHDDANVRADR